MNEITNANLVSESEKISRFHIELLEDASVKSIQQLDCHAVMEHSKGSFEIIRFEAVSSVERTADILSRKDFVYILEGVYLKASTQAYEGGDGIEKLGQILNTLDFRRESSASNGLRLTKNTLKAGENLVLELVGHEYVSGLETGCCAGIFLGDGYDEVLSASGRSNGVVSKYDTTTYLISNFLIEKFAKPGRYTIEELTLRDESGKSFVLEINPSDRKHYRKYYDLENKMDTDSGIKLDCCAEIHILGQTQNLFSDMDMKNGRIRKVGNDNYEVFNLPLSKHSHPDRYTVERFKIMDNEGNAALLEMDPNNREFYRLREGQGGASTDIEVLRLI